jgi:hypothetical protein
MVFQSYKVLLALSVVLLVSSFRFPGRLQVQRPQLPLLRSLGSDNGRQEAPLVIEIVAKRTVSERSADQQLVAYNSAYGDEDDEQEDRMGSIMDSQTMSTVVDVVTNPMSLIMVGYAIFFGTTFVSGLVMTILRQLGLFKKPEPTAAEKKLQDVPFQVFECEVCQMQLRPAKGRAEMVFGRRLFRCSRCGSKADAYFNIEDMSDPRAVLRQERLDREAAQEQEDDYGDE